MEGRKAGEGFEVNGRHEVGKSYRRQEMKDTIRLWKVLENYEAETIVWDELVEYVNGKGFDTSDFNVEHVMCDYIVEVASEAGEDLRA